MSCYFPIQCRFWNTKEKKCKLSAEEFQELCDRGANPCEMHQERIDMVAEQEVIKACHEGDFGKVVAIIRSPFTNFGKVRENGRR